jgi:hypothetical protein
MSAAIHPALRRAIIASKSIPKPTAPVVVQPMAVVIAPVITTLPPSYEPGPTPASAVRVKWYGPPEPYPHVSMEKIKVAVSAATKISIFDMVSERKSDPIALARQIAMYLARMMTSRSLPSIGRAFGDRDHTTARHSVLKIERLVAADPAFAARVKAIQESIHA